MTVLKNVVTVFFCLNYLQSDLIVCSTQCNKLKHKDEHKRQSLIKCKNKRMAVISSRIILPKQLCLSYFFISDAVQGLVKILMFYAILFSSYICITRASLRGGEPARRCFCERKTPTQCHPDQDSRAGPAGHQALRHQQAAPRLPRLCEQDSGSVQRNRLNTSRRNWRQ